MTPSEIEPATFRFVAQRLTHCATAVPNLLNVYHHKKYFERKSETRMENSSVLEYTLLVEPDK